jgi:DNA repair and recombination protein RAD54B
MGRERASELHLITKQFMLRRTQEVLEKFLPPRNDLVIFCEPSKLQSQIYKEYVISDDVCFNTIINKNINYSFFF